MLAVLCVTARRAGGVGVEPPARARAEGRSIRNSLLFAAAFSAFAVVFAVFAFGRVAPLALSPAVLVALLLTLGAARRSPFLQLAGLSLGVLCALAGLAVSLVRAI